MRSIPTVVLVAVGACLIGVRSTAQSTPNFSGTWILTPESTPKASETRPGTGTGTGTGARTGGGSVGDHLLGALSCSNECTIVQTAQTMTIKRSGDPQGIIPAVVILNLDGSDSKNQQPGPSGGAPVDYVAHAKWSGKTLVVTRAVGGQVVTTQTLSLVGGKLTIAHSINLDVTGLPTLIYTKK